MASRDDRIELLGRPGKLGLGTAYLAGFHHALDRGYKRVVTMDADFSHHPRYLPAIPLGGQPSPASTSSSGPATCSGGVEGWPLWRRLLSLAANTFARLMLGLRTHDNTGAYRCYSRKVVEELELDSVVSMGIRR